MANFKKTARIERIGGIMLSDPSYGRSVPCRYECNEVLEGWGMDFSAKEAHEVFDDLEYDALRFALVLRHPALRAGTIEVDDELGSFSYPKGAEVAEFEIGMDTACVYCGEPVRFSENDWQPAGCIRTGTDGLFADAFELRKDGTLLALVAIGSIDPLFASAEELFGTFKATFKATEA